MTVGIVGLGLIGGSFAKCYHAAGARVLAEDADTSILEFAMLSGVVDERLTAQTLPQCDLVLLALYPDAAIRWLQNMAPHVAPGQTVLDCCGTKRKICAAGFSLAEQYGFLFVGGHPMAGSQYSGFRSANAHLFRGAPMVLVPPNFADIALLSQVKQLLAPAEFGKMTVCSAQEHDAMIAFTSQLAHLVSNAYIKSPSAGSHRGFSAGSYRDMTRVAWLNAPMWTELFLENGDYLLQELHALQAQLGQYENALQQRDATMLCALLEEGKQKKWEVDGA